MPTSKLEYQGDLRVKSTHIQSGNSFITDAPTDNHGKGEAFSPTDTVANGLAACMLTVMGIKANALEADITGATAEVTKIMAANPRRIAKIKVSILFPKTYDEKVRKILENTAQTCPVLQSLHPAIEKDIHFSYKQ
ncbi:MAG: OsmC family protein [Mesonia hippocampi]|uniref:OsmC family protein n=1 Tax=Mesonia hippocampi TaxID=1628250 RepID=UPI003F989CD7